MEGMFYNVQYGYIEGIVRGYRNTLLTGQNYGNLTQCETVDGEQSTTCLDPWLYGCTRKRKIR